MLLLIDQKLRLVGLRVSVLAAHDQGGRRAHIYLLNNCHLMNLSLGCRIRCQHTTCLPIIVKKGPAKRASIRLGIAPRQSHPSSSIPSSLRGGLMSPHTPEYSEYVLVWIKFRGLIRVDKFRGLASHSGDCLWRKLELLLRDQFYICLFQKPDFIVPLGP